MLLNNQNTSGVSRDNPYFKSGTRRYNELNNYLNSGEDGIAQAVRDRTLLPGSNAWNDLTTKGFGPVLTQAQGTITVENDITSSIIEDVFGFDINGSLESQ